MIAGSGARARTLGPGLGTPGRSTVLGLTVASGAPRTAVRVAGLVPAGGQCTLWSSRQGCGTELGGRRWQGGSPGAECVPRRPRGGFPDTAGRAEQRAQCPVG